MTTMDQGTGRCLCGAVRYEFTGPPKWQAHCHCESCRRNCSAPYTSYFAIPDGKWQWTGAKPAIYASSPGVRRHFCATCGTPMAFAGDTWPGELHFYAASLADPTAFVPTAHVNWNERLPWGAPVDGLHQYRTPRRIAPEADFAPALGLIRDCFASMAGRIDPPSSADSLTVAALAAAADKGEVWGMDDMGRLIACMILTPRPDHLYIGKLATDPAFRRQGLARQLIWHAAKRAKALGLAELRLETRVELTGNHATFQALGFSEIARTAHAGFAHPTSITFARSLT